MKSSSFLSSILQPVFSLRPKPGRPVTCSVILPKPQIPIYLRPPAFRVTLSNLKNWHIWAKNQASSVGSVFSDLDNGPDSTLLHRELNWLVEDALERPALLLPQNSRNNYEDATPVSVRACLDDLYKLWKQRIENRRPFQYVVGCEHWRDLILSVEEGVLIPRPETEIIVDLVDDAVKRNKELKNGLWADLGTGSGALAIGIARVLGPGCGKVVAIDLSPVAVAVASYNVERYNLQDRISVRLGSWFDPLKDVAGGLSGLVSNPPYIPSEDIDGLQAEVCKHEPRLALDGGPNGMNDLVHLCDGAASMLKPGGFFAFETNGETQSKSLVDYMHTEKVKGSFCNINIVSDFAGIQRFVTGYKA
ncbi:release factor glutamine methyltransferase [Phtheirospermum japonicum]|uniref:Release factor glutamine methyltransferase n=1 Tax=Phtheirospermum japonicum TaxID=374723 RepID=A0A830DNX4_9LAMI|nr:release factor glutamine methyltransferase [Phtheirospermum japonicum]